MISKPDSAASGWTVDTLGTHVLSALADMDKRYEERFKSLSAMTTETDRRYEQRFLNQQEALPKALDAQKELVQAALISSKEAVAKAEVSANDRFVVLSLKVDDQAETTREVLERLRDEFQKAIAALGRVQDTSAGRDTGVRLVWGVVTGLVVVVAALAGMLARVL